VPFSDDDIPAGDSVDKHSSSLLNLYCSACERGPFPSETYLSVHLHELHSPLFLSLFSRTAAPFLCVEEGCGRQFSSQEKRKKHLISDHGWSKSMSVHNKSDRNRLRIRLRSNSPICRFFNTKNGCRSGESCRFRHSTVNDDDNGGQEGNEDDCDGDINMDKDRDDDMKVDSLTDMLRKTKIKKIPKEISFGRKKRR